MPISGDYTYTLAGSDATITAYSGAGGDITIPSTLDGYSVVAIGYNAFQSNHTLTSVVIPDSVTEIFNWAFNDCSALTSISISNTCTTLHYQAFSQCVSIISVIIPASVTSFYNNVFTSCTSLTYATFLGDAPSMGLQDFFDTTPGFTVFYDPAKAGWSNPWNGYPALPIGSTTTTLPPTTTTSTTPPPTTTTSTTTTPAPTTLMPYPDLIIGISANPQVGRMPLTVNLTGISNNQVIIWHWFINNVAQVETSQQITKVFSQKGTYSVMLRATDIYGQGDQIFSADILTSYITVGNVTNINNGSVIKLRNEGGHLPIGLVGGVVYYVVSQTGNMFKLSTTKGGSPVVFSDNGTGTNYITKETYATISVLDVLSTLDTAIDLSDSRSIMGAMGSSGVVFANPGISTKAFANVASFQNAGFTHKNGPNIIFS